MDEVIHTLKYGEAVVKIEDLVRGRELTFQRGYNKGVIVGAVAAVAVIYGYKYAVRNRTQLFNRR